MSLCNHWGKDTTTSSGIMCIWAWPSMKFVYDEGIRFLSWQDTPLRLYARISIPHTYMFSNLVLFSNSIIASVKTASYV